jgi:hydroxymethylbilane synthase
LRPDLVVEPLRGNLDTRLRKLDEGQYDAIVLAAAGLKRLGLGARIRSVFEPDEMLPCAGQGALGIEVRADNRALLAQLDTFTHRPTWLVVQAERAVSRALGGSCSMPLAVHGSWRGDRLWLRAVLGHPQQPLAALLRSEVEEAVQTDAQARALGERAAQALRSHGAAGYLADA